MAGSFLISLVLLAGAGVAPFPPIGGGSSQVVHIHVVALPAISEFPGSRY